MKFLKWRRLTNRIHLYLGLAATLPIVLLSLTGAALVFEPELERWLDPGLWYVQPRPERVAWQALLDAAKEAHPGQEVIGMQLPLRPDLACVLLIRPKGAAPEDEGTSIFVDPHTGRVLGERGSRSSLMRIIVVLHTSYFLTWGGYIAGAASAILLFLLASGLVLWWPTGKDKAAGFRVRFGRHWRTSNYDLHRAAGFYASAILAVIALTGCVFTFHTVLHPLIRTITFSKDTPRVAKASPIPGAPRLSLDEILARGDAAMPGTRTTIVVLPRKPDDPIRLTRRKPSHEPRDYGRAFLSLHPQTGEVLLENSYRKRSLGDAVISWNRHMHVGAWGVYFGDEFGLVTKSLWLLVSLFPTALAVTGILIWWKPKPRKKAGSAARSEAAAVAATTRS